MNFFELIYADDAMSLMCLVAIFFIVGANMADATVRRWGWRAAAAAYVVFVIYAGASTGPTRAAELAYIAFRGLYAGGLAVGTAWILMAITMFFVGEMRAAKNRLEEPREENAQTRQTEQRVFHQDADSLTDWKPKIRDFSLLPPEAWQEFQDGRRRAERLEQEAHALLAKLRKPVSPADPSLAERRRLQTQLDELQLARQFFTASGEDPHHVGQMLAECNARVAALQQALGHVATRANGEPPELAGVAVFDEAIARRPDNPALYVERAKYMVCQRCYKEAISDCHRALKLLPMYGAAFNVRGCACHQLKKYSAAVRDFERAIHENPPHSSAYVNLAATYNATGAHREAIGPASYVAIANPKGHHQLAVAYEQLGEPEKAVHHLSMLVQSDPNADRFHDARVRRAKQLWRLGRAELALHDLKTHLARRPDAAARALLAQLERLSAFHRRDAEETSQEEEEVDRVAGESGPLDLGKQ